MKPPWPYCLSAGKMSTCIWAQAIAKVLHITFIITTDSTQEETLGAAHSIRPSKTKSCIYSSCFIFYIQLLFQSLLCSETQTSSADRQDQSACYYNIYFQWVSSSSMHYIAQPLLVDHLLRQKDSRQHPLTDLSNEEGSPSYTRRPRACPGALILPEEVWFCRNK